MLKALLYKHATSLPINFKFVLNRDSKKLSYQLLIFLVGKGGGGGQSIKFLGFPPGSSPLTATFQQLKFLRSLTIKMLLFTEMAQMVTREASPCTDSI